MDKSLWFEDFKIGKNWNSSPVKVSQRSINHFALLTGDKSPLHLNSKFSKNTVFGKKIAHGALGLSIGLGRAYQLGIFKRTVLAFAFLNWTFTLPVFPGDKIHLLLQVKSKKASKPGRGLVCFAAHLINQKGKIVQQGEWGMVIYMRNWRSIDLGLKRI